MAKQQDNLIYFDRQLGIKRRLGDSNNIAISGDMEVGGNLSVLGTMTYVDSEILTSDNYLFMNSEYTGNPVAKGGLILNNKMDSTKKGSINSISASSGTITINGVITFNAGDVISVVGSNEKLNDGLYEVATTSTTSNHNNDHN